MREQLLKALLLLLQFLHRLCQHVFALFCDAR
jgi:hypothetical protein